MTLDHEGDFPDSDDEYWNNALDELEEKVKKSYTLSDMSKRIVLDMIKELKK